MLSLLSMLGQLFSAGFAVVNILMLIINNNGNLYSAYTAAQSAKQAYTHNVHRDGKCYPKIYFFYISTSVQA